MWNGSGRRAKKLRRVILAAFAASLLFSLRESSGLSPALVLSRGGMGWGASVSGKGR